MNKNDQKRHSLCNMGVDTIAPRLSLYVYISLKKLKIEKKNKIIKKREKSKNIENRQKLHEIRLGGLNSSLN